MLQVQGPSGRSCSEMGRILARQDVAGFLALVTSGRVFCEPMSAPEQILAPNARGPSILLNPEIQG